MAAIREAEAFVADWEVRDLLAAKRKGESEPIVEGGINDLVSDEAASVIGYGEMDEFASPRLRD